MSSGALDALYREVVLDHHRQPRGGRPLADYDVAAEGMNPSCGDEVTLQLKFAGERIAAVGVISHGCAISTSSGSMLAEMIDGLSLAEAVRVAEVFKQALHGQDIPAAVDLGDLEALTGVRKFPVRIKCALLPWITLLDAILAFRQGCATDDTTGKEDAAGVEAMTVTLREGNHDGHA